MSMLLSSYSHHRGPLLALVAWLFAVANADCGLYLARYNDDQEWALYSGSEEAVVSLEELLLPIPLANKNEYSPWHDYAWRSSVMVPPELSFNTSNDDDVDVFASGVGSLALCSFHPNMKPSSRNDKFVLESVAPLQVGEALTMDCQIDIALEEKVVVDLEFLQQQGVCLDTLVVKTSDIEGRGAFAKQSFEKGEIVTTSPMIPLDRSQTEIVPQFPTKHKIPLVREHGIDYQADIVLGRQRLLNYCYGSPDSNLLLLPMAPGVHFINHDSQQPNVEIRWADGFKDSKELRDQLPLMELLEQKAGDLVVEWVALREIAAGDEIVMDYGRSWEQEWQRGNETSFRHEIGVPQDFYPSNWDKKDPKPFGDFIASPLSTGQMAPIRWKDSAKVVSPWAFRIGLQSRVRQVLLEYCHRMGITEIFRHVTVQGNGLEPGTESHMDVHGDDWYLQRPEAYWRSNLHWFSPGAGPAHEHYLQALSVAGFDEILDGIAEYLGMDGLVVFHVTFIAVSFSTRGYQHHDVIETDGKVYNVIIPLILANETGPELDLQSWDGLSDDVGEDIPVGRYRYEYNVASMMGDGAVHATSACDYRNTKEMRMAATVYIADVNEENMRDVMKHYTQAYPPRDIQLLRSWKARHWKRGDPDRKLPEPEPGHILYDYKYSTETETDTATDEL